jgi:hypothetical protein
MAVGELVDGFVHSGDRRVLTARQAFHSGVCCWVRTRNCRSRSSRGGESLAVQVLSREAVHWVRAGQG